MPGGVVETYIESGEEVDDGNASSSWSTLFEAMRVRSNEGDVAADCTGSAAVDDAVHYAKSKTHFVAMKVQFVAGGVVLFAV